VNPVWVGCVSSNITRSKGNVWSCLVAAKIERSNLLLIFLAEFGVGHVVSSDNFMTFFLSYIYEDLGSDDGLAVDFNITYALLYFDSFSSWEPEQANNFNKNLEKFAEYIVGIFPLPRVLIPSLYYCNYNEHVLIRNCSQSLIG
jgi:hypothetical protein